MRPLRRTAKEFAERNSLKNNFNFYIKLQGNNLPRGFLRSNTELSDRKPQPRTASMIFVFQTNRGYLIVQELSESI